MSYSTISTKKNLKKSPYKFNKSQYTISCTKGKDSPEFKLCFTINWMFKVVIIAWVKGHINIIGDFNEYVLEMIIAQDMESFKKYFSKMEI